MSMFDNVSDRAITRLYLLIKYSPPSQRMANALQRKYWWANTNPDDIDDELGMVIDGQFFGPRWMKPVVYKAIDLLESRARKVYNKWTDVLHEQGIEPPSRYLTIPSNR